MRPSRSILLRANRANAGVASSYQNQLDQLIDNMHRSVSYWLLATYRAEMPGILAEDINPAAALLASLKRLTKRWQDRFAAVADDLAKGFAAKVKDRSDRGFAAAAKKAGMTIKFKMTAPMQTAYSAVIGEQVGLIKSIPAQHLAQVQQAVMRSVQAGRDLGPLAKKLEAEYGVTKRRAALIARDQNNKATAVLTRVRQLELVGDDGEAEWLHSFAGKHPRPDHVAAHGRRYKIKQGCLISGEYIMPGELINCRCTCRLVFPV